MKKILVLSAAAVLAGSLYSCKKESPVKSSSVNQGIKEIAACTTPPTFLGVRAIGGTGYDLGRKVEVAANGDVILTTMFQSTVDFDQGAGVFNLNAPVRYIDGVYYPNGSAIQRSGAAGNFISAEDLGPLKYADGSVFDPQGNRYKPYYEADALTKKNKLTITKYNTAGVQVGKIYTDTISGPLNFNWLHYSNGYMYTSSPSGKLSKYTLNGGLVWQTLSVAKHAAIKVDAQGNLYAASGSSGYVEKYDANGTFLWSIRNGSNSDVKNIDVTFDNAGNIYVLGNFTSDADFNPGAGTHTLTAAGKPNLFLQKLSPSGQFVWAVQTKNNDQSNTIMMLGLAIDATAGNIYITGGFTGKPNFNTSGGTSTVQSNGESDIFVMRLRQCK